MIYQKKTIHRFLLFRLLLLFVVVAGLLGPDLLLMRRKVIES